jgi:signal transduction histidine kinase
MAALVHSGLFVVESTRPTECRYPYLEPLAWTMTAGIVVVDLLLPPGFAVGVLYVGVILVALWVPRRAFLFQYAGAATGLEVVGLFVPFVGGSWTMGGFNRGVSLGALWATACGIALFRRERAARDAAEARLREQAALAELGKMAGAVAHEVRNALAGIGPSVQFLAGSASLDPREEDLGTHVSQRLGKLGDMVADLLAFAEMRPIALAAVPLRSLVHEAADMVRVRSDSAQVAIRVDVPDIVVRADGEVLRRALFNLILNGVQAMRGEGEITIRADVHDRRWRLELADQGPGIPPAARARLFEPFFSTKTHGVGLGLAFVRRVVSAHCGTIEVRSPPGGGTVVVLDLPL